MAILTLSVRFTSLFVIFDFGSFELSGELFHYVRMQLAGRPTVGVVLLDVSGERVGRARSSLFERRETKVQNTPPPTPPLPDSPSHLLEPPAGRGRGGR